MEKVYNIFAFMEALLFLIKGLLTIYSIVLTSWSRIFHSRNHIEMSSLWMKNILLYLQGLTRRLLKYYWLNRSRDQGDKTS
jgi:hypothetical protein